MTLAVFSKKKERKIWSWSLHLRLTAKTPLYTFALIYLSKTFPRNQFQILTRLLFKPL